MTATFWGSFAAARGLAIPAAILLSPEVIMWSSLATAFGRGSVKSNPLPDPDPHGSAFVWLRVADLHSFDPDSDPPF
jgi:hypothetical protein